MYKIGDKIEFPHSEGKIEGKIVKYTPKGVQIQDRSTGTIVVIPNVLAHLLKLSNFSDDPT